MTGNEKTNNISIDQVGKSEWAPHSLRLFSFGTEGGQVLWKAKTLSHYGPGRPIPSMHKPQEILIDSLSLMQAKALIRCGPVLKRIKCA